MKKNKNSINTDKSCLRHRNNDNKVRKTDDDQILTESGRQKNFRINKSEKKSAADFDSANISNLLQNKPFISKMLADSNISKSLVKKILFSFNSLRIFIFALILTITLIQIGPVFDSNSSVSAETKIDRWGKVSGSSVNMRQQATTTSSVVATLPLGTSVYVKTQITGQNVSNYGNQWYSVTYTQANGKELNGFINAGLVMLNEDAPVNNEYDEYLKSLGFPSSYWPALRTLHAKYPNWTFTPMFIDAKYDWNTILKEQSKTGRSLIPASSSNALKSYASDSFNFANDTWIMHDSNSWVMANQATIAHYLDPRNWLDEMYIFMFENLKYNPDLHKRSGVASILAGTFMEEGRETFTYQVIGMDNKPVLDASGKVITKTGTYVDAFMEAAEKTGVCPYHLASRSRLEIGVTKSGSVTGNFGDPFNGLYNFYNIGASQGTNPVRNGLEYAKYGPDRKAQQTATDDRYLIPWDSPWRSIVGGAVFIGSSYINRNQHTLYLQKFDLDDQYDGVFWHQYMGNLAAPRNEAFDVYRAYRDNNQLNNSFEFIIPVISGMPDQPAALPTDARSQNNWLKSVNTGGIVLSPAFDPAKTEYSSTVNHDITSITLTGTPVNSKAKIAGSGTYELKPGTNVIIITVTSEAGTKREYKFSIIRKAKDGTVPVDVNVPQNPIPALQFNQNIFRVDGSIITGLDPAKSLTTVENFVSNLGVPTGYQVQVLDAAGKAQTNTIGTGNTVRISYENLVTQNFTIVVYGDTNGDGRITSADLNQVFNHVLQRSTLSGPYEKAADVDKNGKVTSADLNQIFNHVLQKANIQQ